MVDAHHAADAGVPNRTSLPSRLPPGWLVVVAWFAPAAVSFGLPFSSNIVVRPTTSAQITTMTASSTQP